MTFESTETCKNKKKKKQLNSSKSSIPGFLYDKNAILKIPAALRDCVFVVVTLI